MDGEGVDLASDAMWDDAEQGMWGNLLSSDALDQDSPNKSTLPDADFFNGMSMGGGVHHSFWSDVFLHTAFEDDFDDDVF